MNLLINDRLQASDPLRILFPMHFRGEIGCRDDCGSGHRNAHKLLRHQNCVDHMDYTVAANDVGFNNFSAVHLYTMLVSYRN